MRKVAAVLSVIFVFLLGMLIGTRLLPPHERVEVRVLPAKQVVMKIPAIDSQDRGVIATLTTRVEEGSGDVLIRINDVLPGFETQQSARTAARVASNYANVDLRGINIIFSIKANATVIEGPSAGAAMAISAIAALQNRSIRDDVMITGAIDEDGRILSVGGIREKARAAKQSNASLFLVPPHQNYRMSIYDRERSCNMTDGIEYCKVDYVQKTVTVGEMEKIDVKEVSTVEEAVKYFYE